VSETPEHVQLAAERYCRDIGASKIERAIHHEIRGYRVTSPNGVATFHSQLSSALRQIIENLDHGKDRDILVFGEEEAGSQW
jgi:hypothetical protein